MIVNRNGDDLFGMLLPHHVLIKTRLDLVRRGDVVNREYGLGSVFLFLLDLQKDLLTSVIFVQ